jgi:hypothetical protein
MRIFGPKREEVARGWINLHKRASKPVPFTRYYLGVVKVRRHEARMGEINDFKVLVVKLET